MDDLNDNWAAWLESTTGHVAGGESRRFGSIRCSSAGVPEPLFNQAFVFEDPSFDDLANATSWFASRGVPYLVTSPAHVAASLGTMAESAGLRASPDTLPGMVLRSLAAPPTTTREHDIRVAADPASLEDAAIVTAEAFGAPSSEAARHLIPDTMIDDDDIAWFVGYVDGEVAACGQLLRTGEIAGVYGIGVRQRFRHRGLGTAITAAVLAAGRESGCSTGVLQASPMGKSVYDAMGFETFTDYHRFVAG